MIGSEKEHVRPPDARDADSECDGALALLTEMMESGLCHDLYPVLEELRDDVAANDGPDARHRRALERFGEIYEARTFRREIE